MYISRRGYRNETGSTSTSTRAPRGTVTFVSHARSNGCIAMSRRAFSNNRRRCLPRRIASHTSKAGRPQVTVIPRHPIPETGERA